MTQRTKLELAINTPIEISLLFDDCVSGSSQYGNYNLYAVESAGMEYSFFAPDSVHDQIKGLKKGQSAIITKLAAQRGNKVVTAFDVIVPNPVAVVSEAPSSAIKPYVELDNNDRSDVDIDKGNIGRDNSYSLMLQSLKDGIALSSELGGGISIDIEKLAICMFIQRSKSNSYGG